MTATEPSVQAAFAAALLDPAAPVPAGLTAWNGSDPALRFAVHRNHVLHALAAVLADTFPVVHCFVGGHDFAALARRFIVAQPPTSPLMHRYGERFPDWLEAFEPGARPACLPDLARLELARLRAFHAADIAPFDARRLASALHDPDRLAGSALQLAPSLTVLASQHPVVSLWSAHQFDPAERDRRLGDIDLDRGEAALVFRTGDEAWVLGIDPASAALAAALATGLPLGPALAAHPAADVARLLGLLLQHGLVADLHEPRIGPPP